MSHALDRRDALTTLGALGAAALTGSALAQPDPKPGLIMPGGSKPAVDPWALGWDKAKGEYVLPLLPYDKNALEPHIDAQTMEIHHDKHHAAYVAGLNKALKELKNIRDGGGDASLIKHWSREVSFHGSGHINHTLFWNMMAPAGKGGGGQPSGKLAEAITTAFGSFDKFLAQFKAAATQVEGGGWAWLVYDPVSKGLGVIQEEKQQDMMLTGSRPILGIDVWEHAYYLKYQNKRGDYISAWMNVVNWGFAGELFEKTSA
jgi:Fe-Mn family superoxide dismutase